MTNDGGRAHQPTSYDLRPPAPAWPNPYADPAAPPVTQDPAAMAVAPGAAADVAPGGTGPVGGPGMAAGSGSAMDSGAAAGPGPAMGPGTAGGSVTAAGPGTAVGEPGAGRRVGGRYLLRSRLGHGGMGTVWRAHDEVVDREVAVKEPRVPDHLPESMRQTIHLRMQREARAAARVAHPSVVAVHDVVVEDGRPWIVMELVKGQSLGGRLNEGTLDAREAARVGLAVLGALEAAHEAGVLHRDVKPDNVLLGRHDRVVLTDFGIAQIEGEQGLTETGGFIGSPEFVAPERALGQRPGPASDLWSLGVVLYAAVEGMSPFRRSNTQATMQAVLSAEPPRPTRGPAVFTDIVMRLLRKEPSARPTTSEVRAALEEVARPAPVAPASAAPTPAVTGSRWIPPVLHHKRKTQWSLGVGVVVVGAAVALFAINPFGYGPATPLHWKVVDEPEIVKASLAVPEDYVKEIKPDEHWVLFNDPGGVYRISLFTESDPPAGSSDASDKTKQVDSARGEAAKRKADFEKGNLSGITEAKSSIDSAPSFDGLDSVEMTTVYRKSGSGDNDPKAVRRTRVIVNKAKDTAWYFEVTMPEKGKARADGDKLYKEALRYLKLKEK
ncbi:MULTISPECIES: serine/threonine-protein kinase [Streptomyces]|uniref:serine/threonine-protein kinase n=1 Tax=Streptomyces TaxID=1883 RepID=UPI00163BDA81|nr:MULTISPECIES: serine/threonine-protein kinase [Streptomyces]MBC2878455.1 serine/threonine protein kinase [Streptomyces sp. TYQ1024]UBI38788.1 serine/threonine protein kinase [Streptomyces mobaraensis]UKW31369.1 serine/threonine protein kinase [Streptomyces sp. TYQ1024]